MQQSIHCSVDNCHYWHEGNRCHADQIMVTADTIGASMPDSFDALQAANAPSTPVNSCMETCCKSFVQKGSQSIRMDGLKRI
ncbi:MAG: DUF1540 domain-containing protein [Bacillota bacterium]|nr:DUF1540 domain-containing protein [Mollicutes bacterium]